MTEIEREKLDAELATLNAKVTAALDARQTWMDSHMVDYAKYKIGETLYDLETGRELGVVSKLYRFWSGRDPRYDTCMDISYEYCVGRRVFGNTNSQPYLSFGNAADIERHLQRISARFKAQK